MRVPLKCDRLWSLIPVVDGQNAVPIALSEGNNIIGRDAACALHFANPSISRRHAEFSRDDGTLRVRDLGSRNGIRVNGVPRSEAVLQHGDTVEVGALVFQVSAGPGLVLPRPMTELPLSKPDSEEPTRKQRIALTKLGNARSLSTLYHVCSWLVDDLEEKQFTEKCLRVLLEGLEAQEVQLYQPQTGLVQWAAEKENKPAFKFVPFLVGQYSDLPEAASIPGADVRKHQPAAGKFNFLLAPLRPARGEDGEYPFLAVLRPAQWRDFTTDDRVLLQTVSQLWVRAVQRVRNVAALRSENALLKRHVPQPRLLGNSPALESLRHQALKAARTNITVTLAGETGSGKEVVAHFLHQNSPRQNGPFVKVNCAAIPESLIESELFGHEKGAYTDARGGHRGKFEQAHGGTLFLDEIGELSPAVQGKFLRALETGEIEKLGSEKHITVDVRIVAASHRDLAQMARARQFREDLFYRLDVLTLRVPPLREHKEDIPEIAAFFLAQFCAENGLAELAFASDALAALQRHNWPGNVRELRNVVQRCAIHASQAEINAALVMEQLAAVSG
jgi:transcriptional regulator with GAF, ATPase, and Fis domain